VSDPGRNLKACGDVGAMQAGNSQYIIEWNPVPTVGMLKTTEFHYKKSHVDTGLKSSLVGLKKTRNFIHRFI
jgi:hypothetical protein